MREAPAAGAAPVKQRDSSLDLAKGLGIFLVVLGHIVSRDAPSGLNWPEHWKSAIYTFHMPFFVFISGLIALRFARPIENAAALGRFVNQRALRLLIPYLIFALIVFGAKMLARRAGLTVDNFDPDRQPIWLVLADPMRSSSVFLWFVYALFFFSLTVPMLLRCSVRQLLAILGLAAAAWFWAQHMHAVSRQQGQDGPPPSLAVLVLFADFYAFFVFGALTARWPAFQQHLRHFWRWALAAFLTFFLMLFAHWQFGSEFVASLFKIGIAWLAGPSLWAACDQWQKSTALRRVLVVCGTYSFPIYLMNTLCIGLAKAILIKAGVGWNARGFSIHLPALFLAGIITPILLQRWIIEKTPVLRNLLKK